MDMLADCFALVLAGVERFLRIFSNPASSFSFWPVTIFVLLAFALAARQLRISGVKPSLRETFRKAFPGKVYQHPSAWRDGVIFFLNEGLFFYFQLFAGLIIVAAIGGPGAHPEKAGLLPPFVEFVLLSIYFSLAVDFSSTLSHYLKHKVPFLWEFHKVHHSAPVMTPITAMRRHPVDMIVNGVVINGGVAIALLIWGAAFQSSLTPATIFGASAAVFFWRLSFYNLRHSHLWLDYGPFWSRIFISPAQHHVHHSNRPEHYDCNFGLIFAFWDRLFGTLYVPSQAEKIEFGIDPAEMGDFETITGMYLTPFANVGRKYFGGVRSPVPEGTAPPAE